MKKILILLLLFVPLLANPPFSKEIDKLSNTQQWLRLLHFKNNKSEIDDKKFFFSKNGKTDPKAELQATIEKLISDKSDDKNSTLCRYISRSTWILEELPQLKRQITIPKCKKLNKEIKALGAKQITLVLASAHINSPASAFGHTFLRIDNNPNTPLLSYAVNYAAQTNEKNGFIYAYQGLFGGYRGRYSIDPYYKKLKEYSDLEQRDVWEYTLELSQKEIDKIVLHIFEIRHFYADYFFLAENCSYNLLWLIEVAKDDVNLTNKFNHKTLPIDTLRAVLSENLVKETIYRASKRKEILALSTPIKSNTKALTFAKSDEYNLAQIEELSKKEKIASLELATALLQIKLSNQKITKKEYLPKFLKILKSRSKLGTVPKQKIKKTPPPLAGHYSTKASLGYAKNREFKARVKIAYHDIYDNDRGYISGAYINFFDTALQYKENKLTLDEINILEIRSYAIQDAIFKPISWQVALGGKRIFNNEFIALNMGILYNPSSTLKFGVLGSNEWFDKSREILEVEPFITYSFDQASALNLRYEYKEINDVNQEDLLFSWFFYF